VADMLTDAFYWQVYIPPIDKEELVRDLRAAIGGSERVCDLALPKVMHRSLCALMCPSVAPWYTITPTLRPQRLGSEITVSVASRFGCH
jgi:hypothetical protein